MSDLSNYQLIYLIKKGLEPEFFQNSQNPYYFITNAKEKLNAAILRQAASNIVKEHPEISDNGEMKKFTALKNNLAGYDINQVEKLLNQIANNGKNNGQQDNNVNDLKQKLIAALNYLKEKSPQLQNHFDAGSLDSFKLNAKNIAQIALNGLMSVKQFIR